MNQQDPTPQSSEVRPDAEGAHQAALLIDFDNVTMGIRSNLGQELRNLLYSDVIRGKVAVQRAYADWRRYPQYIVPLSETSVDLIFAPAYGSSKKNATDIRLAIDALELVFTRPEIKTFILMSGDSDFSSLVLKLKEYGKYVIGVGIQESSSDLLVQNCDEYYSYSALSGLTKAGEEPRERHDPWVLVAKAVGKMVERGDTMRSDRLKQVMLEIDPTFNDKEHGFSRFNRFVVEAASRGLLSIQKMENGQYAVLPGAKTSEVSGEEVAAAKAGEATAEKPETKAEKSATKVAGRRTGSRRKGRTKEQPEGGRPDGERGETSRARPRLTLEAGIELLDRALGGLLDGPNDSVRDSDIKRRLLEIDPDFDEGELGFSKFSKFLQEADAVGAIVLTRGPNRNYVVSRPRRSSKKKRGRRGQARPSSQAAPTPAPEGAAKADSKEAPREPAMKRFARMLFGGDPETPQPLPTSETAPKGEKPARPPPPAGASGTDARAKRERQKGPRQRERRKPGRGRRPESGRASGRSSERARREASREPVEGAQGSSSNDSQALVMQVKEPTTVRQKSARPETVTQKPTEAHESVDATVTSAPLTGAPRGTIRGRWGASGRYRPAQSPPRVLRGQTRTEDARAQADGPAEARVGPQSKPGRVVGGRPRDPAAIVTYLSTRYSGVGKKTAAMLVDEFGPDLFRVLDEEPGRIREILPDHRAERVLEAHRDARDADRK